MIVTDLAMQDMTERSEGFLQRVVQALLHPFRNGHSPTPALATGQGSGTLPPLTFAAGPGDSDHPLRKHPRLRRVEPVSDPTPVDISERRARAAAARAILLARANRFDEARSAFHAAALADSELDLSDIPGFWDLSRRGMFAAIQGYEDLERYREAAMLEARIRRTYRPQAVPGIEAGTTISPKVASGR